jgi:hypothetical protein
LELDLEPGHFGDSIGLWDDWQGPSSVELLEARGRKKLGNSREPDKREGRETDWRSAEIETALAI